jgi:hypothetical protein
LAHEIGPPPAPHGRERHNPRRDDVALHFVPGMDGTLGGMHDIAELTARGDLSATIGRRYTLDEGPQA